MFFRFIQVLHVSVVHFCLLLTWLSLYECITSSRMFELRRFCHLCGPHCCGDCSRRVSLEIRSFQSSNSPFSNLFGYSRLCVLPAHFRIGLPISIKKAWLYFNWVCLKSIYQFLTPVLRASIQYVGSQYNLSSIPCLSTLARHSDRAPNPAGRRVVKVALSVPEGYTLLPVPTAAPTLLLYLPCYTAFASPHSLLGAAKNTRFIPAVPQENSKGFRLQHLRGASQGDQASEVSLTRGSRHTIHGHLLTRLPGPQQLYHSMVFALSPAFS